MVLTLKTETGEAKEVVFRARTRVVNAMKEKFKTDAIQDVMQMAMDTSDFNQVAYFITQFCEDPMYKTMDGALDFIDDYLYQTGETIVGLGITMVEVMDEAGFLPKKGLSREIGSFMDQTLQELDFTKIESSDSDEITSNPTINNLIKSMPQEEMGKELEKQEERRKIMADVIKEQQERKDVAEAMKQPQSQPDPTHTLHMQALPGEQISAKLQQQLANQDTVPLKPEQLEMMTPELAAAELEAMEIEKQQKNGDA